MGGARELASERKTGRMKRNCRQADRFGCAVTLLAWAIMMLLVWLVSRTFGTSFDPLAALALTGFFTAAALWK